MISIRMIKLCGNSIYKRFKKGDHQCVKNYRPISLLPVFSKIFERLIYNAMFKHFLYNNLISSNQSGFKPGDSCINQLIAITHKI